MTKFDAYFDGARQYLYDNPNQRRGQAFYNYLRITDPTVAEQVPEALDPFNLEYRFDGFLTFLRSAWSGLEEDQ